MSLTKLSLAEINLIIDEKIANHFYSVGSCQRMQAEVLISDAGKTSDCLTVQYKKKPGMKMTHISPIGIFSTLLKTSSKCQLTNR
jgi:hypothetical protein